MAVEMVIKLLVLILIALQFTLYSCGGGGGSDNDSLSNDNDSQTGMVDDNEVPNNNLIEHLSAGDATIMSVLPSAFSQESANLTAIDRIKRFNIGDDFFENPWVEKRASTELRDGLGPLFNNNACQDCHIRDGRGHAPTVSATDDGTDFSSLLIRASKSNITVEQRRSMEQSLIANVPDSAVGGQLQQDAIFNVRKEAGLRVSYETVSVSFADGHTVELRKPLWHLTSLYAGNGYDFDSDTVFSARVAPPMIGLGMLALIEESDIVANADPADLDGNGISGKANYVWEVESSSVQLGRFGWKAGQPSIRQQIAGAFIGDMGLTNEIFPEENCLAHQTDCSSSPNGNGDQNDDYPFEVAPEVLDNVEFYSHNLAVPARRDAYSDSVQAGKALFQQAGCHHCHIESFTTAVSEVFLEQSKQTIFPYTDMLLHDMGQDLADFTLANQPVAESVLVEFLANAREWRTPPLWGLGLAQTVDPEATFLHDGRARTILEAVLWHGGEAEAAKQHVLQFNQSQRDALLSFLKDL